MLITLETLIEPTRACLAQWDGVAVDDLNEAVEALELAGTLSTSHEVVAGDQFLTAWGEFLALVLGALADANEAAVRVERSGDRPLANHIEHLEARLRAAVLALSSPPSGRLASTEV